MDLLEPTPLPLSLPLRATADVEVFCSELHARLGVPHLVDPEGSGLGIEHVWAFVLKPTGQRLLVVLYLQHGTNPEKIAGTAVIYADSPELVPVLAAIGIEQADHRIRTFSPVPMR